MVCLVFFGHVEVLGIHLSAILIKISLNFSIGSSVSTNTSGLSSSKHRVLKSNQLAFSNLNLGVRLLRSAET